jgi:beta-lactamase superfamily II metal-dependent hydrolase
LPWNLAIHTIDVGRGESSLIVATNGGGGPDDSRTMLVDGGLPAYGSTVHRYVTPARAPRMNHILASHYDDDHSGGLLSLLLADNLHNLLDTIAQTAATRAAGATRAKRVATGAAVAFAVASGAYGAGGAPLPSLLDPIVTDAGTVGAVGDAAAADSGIAAAQRELDYAPSLQPTLIVANAVRRNAARAAGIAAANAMAAGGVGAANAVAIRTAIFNAVRSRVDPQAARFETDGRYRTTHVVDIGDSAHQPEAWGKAVLGWVRIGSFWGRAPGVDRARTTALLGTEILWGSGPNTTAPPPNAPAVFVLAARKMVWGAAPGKVPIASGQPDNDDSIGLVVRFNQFVHYTGGDLPAEGEELVAASVMTKGLPNPAGGLYPAPQRIATIKCGHHGANTSTSDLFLATAKPVEAFISCGKQAGFQHPAQAVVNRLVASKPVEKFHLTNCKYVTDHVPASNGQVQVVPGNKSRVCGDNANVNIAPHRQQRGDICLRISEAESTAAEGPGRRFHVEYLEDDTNGAVTDSITF